MDERRQYVPTSTYTYPATEDKIGIRQETIVREASDKETDYKNTKDVPIEGVEGAINFQKNHKQKND